MLYTFQPTLRAYALTPAFGLVLPVAALLYLVMTMDSAWQHWRGIGMQWKGRTGVGGTDKAVAAGQDSWLPGTTTPEIAPVSQPATIKENDMRKVNRRA